ncbi:testis-expressed protein 22 [Thomomys bottae]
MDHRPSLPDQEKTAQRRPTSLASPPDGPPARGLLDAQSSLQGLQTQDWVSEEPQQSRSSRHWSVSIEERRRLASMGSQDRHPIEGAPAPPKDITQIVAELVTEDVDKDVLLPHSLKSASSTSTVPNLLSKSAPLWQNAAMDDKASKSPQS